MLKNKSIDYIFGMITGASLMLAFWACTQTPLGASGSTIQEVKVPTSKQSDVICYRVMLTLLTRRSASAIRE